MAILFGTTADGETLPVEVNEFGQLIAEGLDGPPGPPGPPGIGQLPPDPFEGALLGWEDGQLAWVGGSVPLPPGTFGPIVSYANGVITLAEELTLLNGQAVFLSDAAGNRFYYQPTAQVTAVNGDVYSVITDFDMWQIGDLVGNPLTFAPVLYTGNGGSQSVTTGFYPGLVWIKRRDHTEGHVLVDSVRGPINFLSSNSGNGESADASYVSGFTSDGFNVGSAGATNGATSSDNLISWCWSAGDATLINNEGTIQSNVSSNGSFSIVQYSGSGSAATVGHGLSTPPQLIIQKRTDSSENWPVYHSAAGSSSYFVLNTSDPEADNSGIFNRTDPTSSVFSVDDSSWNNAQNGQFISYCWAESPTQTFGAYIGGSGGQIIDCGFAPAYVLIKSSNGAGNWTIYDTARGDDNYLSANTSDAEENFSSMDASLISTGFVLNGTDGNINASGITYLYAAFSSQIPATVTDIDASSGTLTITGEAFTTGDVISAGIKSGDGSVLLTTGSSLVLRADNTEWIPGQYVTAPAQDIAARKAVGRKLRSNYEG